WIPYEDLKNIRPVTKGAFGSIYIAEWPKGGLDSFDNERQIFQRDGPDTPTIRPPGQASLEVILKQIEHSSNPTAEFLKELKVHVSLRSSGYQVVHCLGVTKDPIAEDYVLVMWRMREDLRHYIKKNYASIAWKDVYYICFGICSAINEIHEDNLVHKDLHPGNILRQDHNFWAISDLGLCGPPSKPHGSVYGILPYIAPEVLFGSEYTSAADIYSIGMLMYELSTGRLPFSGREHNYELAVDIIDGIRPEIINSLPESYEKLMKRCWDANHVNRPSASELMNYFWETCKSVEELEDFGVELVMQDIPSTVNSYSALYNFDLPAPRSATA
ncbi:14605_t:CDS:2, partial [Acaulospora colombiana]